MVQSTADFLQKLQHVYLKRNVFFCGTMGCCLVCFVLGQVCITLRMYAAVTVLSNISLCSAHPE